MAIDKIFNNANVDGIADNIFGAVNNSVSEVKQMQQRKAAENVQMVVEAFKKIETNITEKFDNVSNVIEKRVLTIKDGRDGINGKDGRDGKDGRNGKDGLNGKPGLQGPPGKDGIDGTDGVSVTDANIDFDGSLIINLSSGKQINVGEIISPELEKKIISVQHGGSSGSGGDVMGPTSATDNRIVRFDGTTGKLIQSSAVTINNSGNVSGVGTLSASGVATLSAGAVIQGLTVGLGPGAVSDNTVVGNLALNSNTTGSSNTAVGQQALSANTSGAYNTAVGWQAGSSGTMTGNFNIVGEKPHSLSDVVDACIAVTGAGRVMIEEVSANRSANITFDLDGRHAADVLKYTPAIDLQTGLAEVWAEMAQSTDHKPNSSISAS